MRKSVIAAALVAAAACNRLPSSPAEHARIDGRRLDASGFTMGSGNATGTPPTGDAATSAATLNAAADSAQDERGGFTMGSGN